jgi:hypothetical protein
MMRSCRRLSSSPHAPTTTSANGRPASSLVDAGIRAAYHRLNFGQHDVALRRQRATHRKPNCAYELLSPCSFLPRRSPDARRSPRPLNLPRRPNRSPSWGLRHLRLRSSIHRSRICRIRFPMGLAPNSRPCPRPLRISGCASSTAMQFPISTDRWSKNGSSGMRRGPTTSREWSSAAAATSTTSSPK